VFTSKAGHEYHVNHIDCLNPHPKWRTPRNPRLAELQRDITAFLDAMLAQNDAEDKLPMPRELHGRFGIDGGIHRVYKIYHDWRVEHADARLVRNYQLKYQYW
jgi:hypothetical protein